MVYLEALACGKPVIGGAGTGAEEALLGGKLGLLVDPDNTEQVGEAIVRMLRGEVDTHMIDPVYLRKTVLAHYGLERFTKRVGELVETMLQADGPAVRS